MNDEKTPAFLTGSRVYGTPHKDSDVDLVVFVPSEDMRREIVQLADDPYIPDGPQDGGWRYACRFGRLNLILCDEAKYLAFRDGTRELKVRKPVTRDEAIKVMKRHREARRAIAGRG